MKRLYCCLIAIWLLNDFSVEAINCYQCNSVNNSACHQLEDGGKFIKPKPCPLEYNDTEPFCRKVKLWYLNFDRVDQYRTIRGCGYVRNDNNKTLYRIIEDGHEEYQYQCFTDDCNGSPSKTISILAIIFSALSYKFLK